MTIRQGTERRREHRYRLERAVQYRVVGDSTNYWRQARTCDVSRRGLRLILEEPVPPGHKLEVYVLAEDRRPKVTGLVEVVRCAARPLMNEYFNEYYNPDMLVDYEIGARSPGSALFTGLADLA